MDPRLQLQNLLEGILGSENVYFQPPSSVSMQYPAIVYQRDTMRSEFAGNLPYRVSKRYQVTYIDRLPDSEVPDKLAALPMCVHTRFFRVNNLNHDVFDIYFPGGKTT